MSNLTVTAHARFSDARLTASEREVRRHGAVEAAARAARRVAKQYFYVCAMFCERMISDGMFATVAYPVKFETAAEAERFATKVRKAGKVNTKFWSGDVNFGYKSKDDAYRNVEEHMMAAEEGEREANEMSYSQAVAASYGG